MKKYLSSNNPSHWFFAWLLKLSSNENLIQNVVSLQVKYEDLFQYQYVVTKQ